MSWYVSLLFQTQREKNQRAKAKVLKVTQVSLESITEKINAVDTTKVDAACVDFHPSRSFC